MSGHESGERRVKLARSPNKEFAHQFLLGKFDQTFVEVASIPDVSWSLPPTEVMYVPAAGAQRSMESVKSPLGRVENGALELELVQAVFRHGARTPLHTWKNVTDHATFHCPSMLSALSFGPHEDHPPGVYFKAYVKGKQLFKGNCATGQLTPYGIKQLHVLGAMMRHRYVERLGFLPKMFDKENEAMVVARSTDLARTQQSMQSLLNGLIPLTSQSGHVTLTIHTMSTGVENMFPRNRCRRYKKLRDMVRARSRGEVEGVEVSERRQALMALMRELIGDEEWTPSQFVSVHNTLASLMVNGKPLPEEIDATVLDDVEREALHDFAAPFDGPDRLATCRVSIGRFVGDLHAQMAHKVAQGKEDPTRIGLYAGHDSTLVPLLMSFELLDGQRFPQVASVLMFELYRNHEDNEHYVRVMYNGHDMRLPQCQAYVVEGHGANNGRGTGSQEGDKPVVMCKFACFQKVAQQLIPDDYEQECVM